MFSANLFRVGIDPSVDTVVCSIETTFGEPNDVPVLEATRANGLEGAIPIEGVPGGL